jgi:hypothetical protein
MISFRINDFPPYFYYQYRYLILVFFHCSKFIRDKLKSRYTIGTEIRHFVSFASRKVLLFDLSDLTVKPTVPFI